MCCVFMVNVYVYSGGIKFIYIYIYIYMSALNGEKSCVYNKCSKCVGLSAHAVSV
jgi:hypothetical protein